MDAAFSAPLDIFCSCMTQCLLEQKALLPDDRVVQVKESREANPLQQTRSLYPGKPSSPSEVGGLQQDQRN